MSCPYGQRRPIPDAVKDMYLEVVLLAAHACLTRVSNIPARGKHSSVRNVATDLSIRVNRLNHSIRAK